MCRKPGWWMLVAALVVMALVFTPTGVNGARRNKTPPPDSSTTTPAPTPTASIVTLPTAIDMAIKDAYPKAIVLDCTTVTEGAATFYLVTFIDSGSKVKAKVNADGVIIEIKTPMLAKDLPAAVSKAIAAGTDGGTVTGYWKVEVQMGTEVHNGVSTLIKLLKPAIVYDGELSKGDQQGRVRVGADGTVLAPVKWEAKPGAAAATPSPSSTAPSASSTAPSASSTAPSPSSTAPSPSSTAPASTPTAPKKD